MDPMDLLLMMQQREHEREGRYYGGAEGGRKSPYIMPHNLLGLNGLTAMEGAMDPATAATALMLMDQAEQEEAEEEEEEEEEDRSTSTARRHVQHLHSSISSSTPTGRAKVARLEAALEAKVVQLIVSGEFQTLLQPNSGKSVAVAGHHVCVSFHDDASTGQRVWEWHGHILSLHDHDHDHVHDHDDDASYFPEYVYGNFFQPLAQTCTTNKMKKINDGNRLG